MYTPKKIKSFAALQNQFSLDPKTTEGSVDSPLFGRLDVDSPLPVSRFSGIDDSPMSQNQFSEAGSPFSQPFFGKESSLAYFKPDVPSPHPRDVTPGSGERYFYDGAMTPTSEMLENRFYTDSPAPVQLFSTSVPDHGFPLPERLPQPSPTTHSQFSSALNGHEEARAKLKFLPYCGEEKIDDTDAAAAVELMKEAHIRICFDSYYFKDIVGRGYKNHKEIPSTSNTNDLQNFLRRLKAERDFFNITSITEADIHKLDLKNLALWKAVKEIFELDEIDDSVLLPSDVDQESDYLLKQHFLNIMSKARFQLDDTAVAPIYGLLETAKGVLQINPPGDAMDKIYGYYGKSYFVLKKNLFEGITTIAINDTFDLAPMSFSLKNTPNECKDLHQGVLCKMQDFGHMSALLKHYVEKQVTYFECHVHTSQIEMIFQKIERVFISKNEVAARFDDEDEAQKFIEYIQIECTYRGIPICFGE